MTLVNRMAFGQIDMKVLTDKRTFTKSTYKFTITITIIVCEPQISSAIQ